MLHFLVYRLEDDDDGAARVGVTETTIVPTEYQYPENPMISFVDLPSIGTPNYPDLFTYSEKVGLEYYDAFLIFTTGRLTQNQFDLAKKVKSIGKSFFLIRNKIDHDCRSEKRKRAYNEEKMLKEIRKHCMRNVEGLISSENEIFLISNYEPNKWDFERLHAAIINALPVHQRECVIQRKTWSLIGKSCLMFMYYFYLILSCIICLIVCSGMVSIVFLSDVI